MPKAQPNAYHYTESGMDNVYIELDPVIEDEAGERTIVIPGINELHRAIANAIVDSEGLMDGKEIRFLRTEMGLTQAELAKLLHRNSQAVARWEKGQQDVDPSLDVLIRQIAAERLGLKIMKTIELLSHERTRTADITPIRIKYRKKSGRHDYSLAA